MNLRSNRVWMILAAMALAPVGAVSCGHDDAPDTVESADEANSKKRDIAPRDWAKSKAIVELPSSDVLYAMSDIHGGYERAVGLLIASGLVEGVPATPKEVRWSGGSALLLVLGDSIDKGPSNLAVIDFLMALEADAARAGGRVIVLLGNHEAEFFVDPKNKKATKEGGLSVELELAGISPLDVADGRDPRGAWLRSLPFGVKVGSFFFSHAGDTGGRSIADLAQRLQAAVDRHPTYQDSMLIGDASILESREWYGKKDTARDNAKALGVRHIVFGHDPSALGPKGTIAVAQDDTLVRIDCGMSPAVDYSEGKLLRVTRTASNDVAAQIDAQGKVTELFSSARN